LIQYRATARLSIPVRSGPHAGRDIDRLSGEIGKALGDPAIRQHFLEADQEPVGGSSAQFASFVHEEYEKYGRLAKELNIKAE
jgi:tripartite-type tricarboxylate transporter receptor subunit TctC